MILATSDVDAMIQKYRSHKNRHFTVEYFLRELAGTNTPKSYISALKHHESQAEAMMNIDTSKYNRAIRHLHSSYTPTLREDYETAQVMS